MSIKKFEAFQGKEITSVDKFIKSLDLKDSKDIIDFLSSVANEIDRPLSSFKGEYLPVKKAKNMDSDGKLGYLKMFFSLKSGLLTQTKTTKSKNNSEDYINSLLHKKGYVSQDLLDGPNLRGITGKLSVIKDIKKLKNNDHVVLNVNGYSNLIHGQIYKEELEDGIEQIYVMTYPKSNYVFEDIPYMISPNESNKLLRKKGYNCFLKILSKGNPVKHTYIGLLEDSDKPIYQEMDRITEENVKFLSNNVVCNSGLSSYRWSQESFNYIENSEFALVFDLDKISEGISLNKLKSDRKTNQSGLLPRINDEFYRKINKDKYRKLKLKSKGIDADDEYDRNIVIDALREAILVLRGRSNMRSLEFDSYQIFRKLLELYIDGDISQSDLFKTLERFDPKLYRDLRYLMDHIENEINFSSKYKKGYDNYGYDDYDYDYRIKY